jgi:hypothetical protein
VTLLCVGFRVQGVGVIVGNFRFGVLVLGFRVLGLVCTWFPESIISFDMVWFRVERLRVSGLD